MKVSPPQPNHFDALDACHRDIQAHLARLAGLVDHIEAKGLDNDAQQEARAIEQFFSSTARTHHA
jgi:hypothetical protein